MSPVPIPNAKVGLTTAAERTYSMNPTIGTETHDPDDWLASHVAYAGRENDGMLRYVVAAHE